MGSEVRILGVEILRARGRRDGGGFEGKPRHCRILVVRVRRVDRSDDSYWATTLFTDRNINFEDAFKEFRPGIILPSRQIILFHQAIGHRFLVQRINPAKRESGLLRFHHLNLIPHELRCFNYQLQARIFHPAVFGLHWRSRRPKQACGFPAAVPELREGFPLHR